PSSAHARSTAVIALVLLLAPFVDAFWARDLGTLKRELVEHPSAERRLLFDDLLQLTPCNKLEKINEPAPLRALVRVEEARRGARGRPKARRQSTLRGWILCFVPRRASCGWRQSSIRPRAGSTSPPSGLLRRR